MKEHVWERVPAGSDLEPVAMAGLPAGQRSPDRKKLGGMELWHCQTCGAGVWSYVEPWTHDDVERIYVTCIECGGGMANDKHLADCDAELVRQILDPMDGV